MGTIKAMAKASFFLCFLLASVASAALLRSGYTVNDKILINGKEVMAGTSIETGCHMAPRDAKEITVCGPAVKVIASLLTECQPYGKYSHEVGTCDSSASGCVTSPLESGYTEKFKWVAASYKVESC